MWRSRSKKSHTAPQTPGTLPTLATLRPGQSGHVMAIDAHDDDANRLDERLMEMGLTPGTLVRVMRCGPFGDPMQLWVRGYLLSLRRAEAMRIRIAPTFSSQKTACQC